MADVPNVNPSPKEKFLMNANAAKAHMDLIARDDLRYSMDVALAHLNWLLSKNTSENSATLHGMSTGAQRLLDIFYNLSIAPYAPGARKTYNLDQDV